MTYPNGPADRPSGDQTPWGQYSGDPQQVRPSTAASMQVGQQPRQWTPSGAQPGQPWGQQDRSAADRAVRPADGRAARPAAAVGASDRSAADPAVRAAATAPAVGTADRCTAHPAVRAAAAELGSAHCGSAPQTGSQQPWSQPAQPGQQGWGQPAAQQPWGQPGAPGGYGPGGYGPPPRKNNKAVLITAVAVVVALIAGFGIWWFAIRDTKTEGKDTPQQAAAQLFADIYNGDVVALADTFDPVEAGPGQRPGR